MKKYRVYGIVTGTKYLGCFEAEDEEEAKQKALESEDNHVWVPANCPLELDDSCCHDAVVEEEK